MAGLIRNPISFKPKPKNEQRRIAVAALSSGAGASFVCSQMLSDAKGAVTLMELGTPHFYLSLGLDKRFDGGSFVSLGQMLKSKQSPSEVSQVYDGVNWLVKSPGEPLFSEVEAVSLISLAPKGIVYFDCSSIPTEMLLSIFYLMDEIYLVLDPLPSKLLAERNKLDMIKASFPKTRIIVNKMNDGVFKSEIKYYLDGSDFKEIPYYYPQDIYSAEYNCILPVIK